MSMRLELTLQLANRIITTEVGNGIKTCFDQ